MLRLAVVLLLVMWTNEIISMTAPSMETHLLGCTLTGHVQGARPTASSTTFQPTTTTTTTWTCPLLHRPDESTIVTVTDTIAAASLPLLPSATLNWTTTLVSPANATATTFAVEIQSVLRLPAPTPSSGFTFHTSWGGGCIMNDGGKTSGLCFSRGPWRDPLTPQPLPADRELVYRMGMAGPLNAPVPAVDSMTLPLVVIASTSANSTSAASPGRAADAMGWALMLSPGDAALRDVLLRVNRTAAVLGRRELRLDPGRPLTLTAHMLSMSGRSGSGVGWRAALAVLSQLYPSHFLPHNPAVVDFEGLGSYSSNLAAYNKTRAARLGFKTNWDLSGTFMPYDGLFLPYQPRWLNLGPINAGLDQYNVTTTLINNFYSQVQAAGLHSLSYFDVGNWGTKITLQPPPGPSSCGQRPGGLPAPCPDPDGSSRFLTSHLSAALLRRVWSLHRGLQETAPILDWVGTTDMDPMEPTLQQLLLEQLARHIELLPAFEGIAIDRLDYTGFYNLDADDGLSLVALPNGTRVIARSLRLSHRVIFEKLSAMLHNRSADRQYIMLMNCNSICRVDLLEAFDGLFSEGSALAGNAFAALLRPLTLWTYDLNSTGGPDLHAFFQQHLLLKAYPMAPMPKNDHSILPGNATVEEFYEQYAPLFTALRGARWLLAADPVAVRAAATTATNTLPLANALLSGDDCLLYPVMLGGPGVVERLNLTVFVPESAPTMASSIAQARSFRAERLWPGESAWTLLAVVARAADRTVAIDNLQLHPSAGAALVRLCPQ